MIQANENSHKQQVYSVPFNPPMGLRNAHIQTVFSSQGPRKANRNRRFKPFMRSQRTFLLDGGDGIRLEGHFNQAAEKTAQELIIMIHGWEGSHESTYMKSMAGTMLQNGYDTFRLNLRDHGDTHHLNRGVFNSTMVEEVVHAIEDLQQRLHYQRYTLVGFSLGGNFSLRVAASAHGRSMTLERVIAFCPVVHAERSNAALNQKRNAFYGQYFIRKWRRSLRKKLEFWPEYQFSEQLEQCKTLNAMNECFVPQYTRFNNVDDYFDAYAITGDALVNTVCPCYLHFSKDDMIIPVEGVGLLPDKPNLQVTVTEHGGHCGFIMNWRGDSWQDVRALDIIQHKANGDAVSQ